MKAIFYIILFHLVQLCHANMASPIKEGTLASSAFSSKDINIFSEVIRIKIDKDFKTAWFLVEYTIQSEFTGNQIPLLFFARDFMDSFTVWIDEVKVTIQDIPEQYIHLSNSPFSMFAQSFTKNEHLKEGDEVSVRWDYNRGTVCKLNDLKYFETNLSKGVHKIKVEYKAKVWKDISDWVNKYSFRYSLSPAKFWKSFGTLTITIEQEGSVKQLTTNIGTPEEKIFQAKKTWTFNKLPDDYLAFSYTPPINFWAKLFIAISPVGLSIFSAILLLIIHLLLSRWYRKRVATKNYSIFVFLISILIPLLVIFIPCLILLIYVYSFELIDNIIGEEAGKYHGYTFLVFIIYPIILAAYWIVYWLMNKKLKNK